MLEFLTEIVFPASCLACGKKPKPICDDCLPVFGNPMRKDSLYYAAELGESLGAVVSTLKDKNRTALIPVLGAALRPCLTNCLRELNPELLVCPPSAKGQYRKRGFNPALEIFRSANPGSLRVTDQILRFGREPKDQRRLSRTERYQNVQNLFEAKPLGARVLLVDDVFTTGATLNAARLALEDAGAKVLGSCVLARRL
jgi:predicted amidophosphoribosyltransferase